MATLVKKKKILTDPGVPGQSLGNYGNLGILQDPGVPGQVIGDYSPIPSIGSVTMPKPPGPTLPTFQGAITNDPVYQNALASFNSALQGGRNNLRDTIRQMVIASGINPSQGQLDQYGLGGYASDLDQATLDAAAQNPLSAQAQLQTATDRARGNISYQLAAQGLLRSGQAATSNSDLTKQYQVQQQQQLNDLLGAIKTNVGNYTDLTNQQQAGLNAAMESVATRLGNQPGQYSDSPAAPPAAAVAPPAAAPATGPVNWLGQSFTTKAALASFLAKTPGGYKTYAAWAADHPTAAARLN